MQYISIRLFKKMVSHARAEGFDVQKLTKYPSFNIDVDKTKAVQADVFFALHEYLDTELGPGFAIRVGQQMKIEDYGVLGLSWRTCFNAGEIFRRSERYFKLLSNTYLMKVLPQDQNSDVVLYRDAVRRGIGLSNEATFSATVVVLKAMTETDIHPVEVCFQHAPPSNIEHHLTAFQCPIKFKQALNKITYKTIDLDTRTAKCDTSIHAFLMDRVQEEEKGMEISSIKIAADVEGLIKDSLPSGIPSIGHIGAHMGMSSRTLTRRLSENGIHFRALVRSIQEKISKDLLRDTTNSISDIAFQTGFSEQSAFSRAFKRWTGLSPLEFRNP